MAGCIFRNVSFHDKQPLEVFILQCRQNRFSGLIYSSIPYNRCLMVVPETYGCPRLFHLSANYIKTHISRVLPHAEVLSCFRSAFQFTPAVSLKSLVLALASIFFSLKTEEDIRPLYGVQVQLWDWSRQTGFVECYQRSQQAKKEGRVEGSRNGAEGEKEGRQEEGGRNRAAQMYYVCLLTH